MSAQSKMSRRRLLTSASGSALLLPLYYPVLASATTPAIHPSTLPQELTPQHREASPSQARFLNRDFMSDRLELIRLLKEITEVEHSLMLQYLYAAFSIKPSFKQLIGTGAPDSTSFIGVAVQEMQHLGSINRLLVELGATPHMDTQDFPFEVDIYPFAMSLEPLSRHSVAKYTYCEASADAVALASAHTASEQRFVQDLTATLNGAGRINHVGSVYETLIGLLHNLRSSPDQPALDYDYWVAELTRIMTEGEADHFAFFKSVFMGTHVAFEKAPEWWRQDPASAHFPGYSAAANPTAFAGHDNQIADDVAVKMAWLGNLHYWTILVMLDFYYRSGDQSAKYLAIGQMMLPLKSIGNELARRGFGLPFDRLSLGYSPAQLGVGNLQFAMHLQQEANQIRRLLEPHLPSDYPATNEQSCSKQLQALVETWSHKNVTANRKQVVFMG